MISHEQIQAALSARIDGEPSGIDDSVIEAHVAGCSECSAFLERALDLAEELHSGAGYEPPSDLSAVILAGVDDEWRRLSHRRALQVAVGKIALGVLAVVWAVWAVRLLVSGAGETDQASAATLASVRFGVALALGLTAWRPTQIPGILLVVGTMFTFNVGFALSDAVLGLGEFAPWLVLIPLLTLVALVWTWAADRATGWRRWWRLLGANPQ